MQKTAHERRIRDMSSDVCFSDLRCNPACPQDQALIVSRTILPICSPASIRAWAAAASANGNTRSITGENSPESISGQTLRLSSSATIVLNRSEEHTSELQSLMRISYAVFCLKKKNTHSHLSSYILTIVTLIIR